MAENTTEFRIENKIGQCVDRDTDSRYRLDCVRVIPRDDCSVFVCATDGRLALAYPAEGRTKRPELCPANILPRKKRGGQVIGNGRWESNEGKFTDTIPELNEDGDPQRFPRLDEVFPVVDCESGSHICLSLDWRLLAKIGEALESAKSNRVTLFIPLPTSNWCQGQQVEDSIAIHGANRASAVLMPCTVDVLAEQTDYNANTAMLRDVWPK